jgi:ferritin-like metal-binding protein YciE
MEKMNDLKDLLKHEIEDLYSVEEQIIEALPKMIEKANNRELKNALSEHLKVTEQHKKRLDEIQAMFTQEDGQEMGKKKGILGGLFGSKPTCKGMKGIIEEGNKIMSADISPEALDAAIIASAQKVEHYEISGYGTARTFARELGLEPIATQLEKTLNEEYAADDLLTQLAVQRVNLKAESKGMVGASAASESRSAGRTKGKSIREERELEPVNKGRSSGTKSSDKGNARGGQPKTSESPRGNGSRGGSSSARPVSDGRKSATKTTARSNRSSSGGRGSSSKGSERGRK